VARFSLSALGADQPGIVAAVSGVLVDLGCNMEDSSMTILRGHFAILVVVAAPPQMSAEELERALGPVAQAFDLVIAVRLLTETVELGDGSELSRAPGVSSPAGAPWPGAQAVGEAWTIVVHGADRPGIVHAVTSVLAEAQANVVDLTTHLVGEPEAPLYVMTLRATLPAGEAGDSAARRASETVSSLGVHCTAQRDEADLL
jgi:glycine cleavage system transcriptional repressor